ncbi:MAG: hypothetical protein ACM3VY_00240 [Candidatus Bathyarchaeota archaeon]
MSNPGPATTTNNTPVSPIGNLAAVGVVKVTLSPAQVAANTTAEQTFTVTGLKAGDFANVNKPTAQAGLFIAGVRVSADDTLAITFGNATASPITPTASEVYLVKFERPLYSSTTVAAVLG